MSILRFNTTLVEMIQSMYVVFLDNWIKINIDASKRYHSSSRDDSNHSTLLSSNKDWIEINVDVSRRCYLRATTIDYIIKDTDDKLMMHNKT